MSAPPAPNTIAPIIREWMDFDDDDTEGQEFAQAVASSIWDQLLAKGRIWYMRDDSALLEGSPVGEGHPVLVIPLEPDHA